MTAHPFPSPNSGREAGGVTILVVLTLLALLTVAAMGMSRNSLREVMIVGASRQAANVRQAADAGLEFAVLWAGQENAPTGASSTDFRAKTQYLLANEELKGEYQAISGGVPTAETTVFQNSDYQQRFTLQLLRFGKLETPMNSNPDTRLMNDLWVVRSSGTVLAGTTTFQHDKEMWLSTPVNN